MIQANIVEAARRVGVQQGDAARIFVHLSPHGAAAHARELPAFRTVGETNQWYAIAKIAGVKLAQAYRREYGMNLIAVMPTNLYGPERNYDLTTVHVAAGAATESS